MLFVLTKIKKRIMTGVKTLLAIAILVILGIQLLFLIENAADYYQRWNHRNTPHGNPLKVFKSIDDSIINGDHDLINKLKKDDKAAENRE